MSKNKNLAILLTIAAVITVATVVFIFSESTSQTASQNQMKNITLPDSLQITDEVVGAGTEASAGNVVTVNYIGVLANGTKFDSSYDRNQPFSFLLGAGQVIKGWDEGVAGMRVGGKRKLVIPPALAYGDQNVGNGLIPPNSTLVFEVDLLNVQPQ